MAAALTTLATPIIPSPISGPFFMREDARMMDDRRVGVVSMASSVPVVCESRRLLAKLDSPVLK